MFGLESRFWLGFFQGKCFAGSFPWMSAPGFDGKSQDCPLVEYLFIQVCVWRKFFLVLSFFMCSVQHITVFQTKSENLYSEGFFTYIYSNSMMSSFVRY